MGVPEALSLGAEFPAAGLDDGFLESCKFAGGSGKQLDEPCGHGLDGPIGGVEDVGAEQLAYMGLSVGGIVFEESSDLATREEFDPIGGLDEPILHGYEEVGGLPNVPDEAGGWFWWRHGSLRVRAGLVDDFAQIGQLSILRGLVSGGLCFLDPKG